MSQVKYIGQLVFHGMLSIPSDVQAAIQNFLERLYYVGEVVGLLSGKVWSKSAILGSDRHTPNDYVFRSFYTWVKCSSVSTVKNYQNCWIMTRLLYARKEKKTQLLSNCTEFFKPWNEFGKDVIFLITSGNIPETYLK